MAAVATKKPGGDLAVQLTFPGEFSRAYALQKLGTRFAPTEVITKKQDFVGDDFQSAYHREKCKEAQQSVMNGVRQTKAAEIRANVSYMGYFGMPKPVRSQRKLGADKGVGLGANIPYYKGDERMGSGLSGGVLGSIEGAKFAQQILAKRLGDLNAIDASSFDTGVVNAVNQNVENEFANQSKVELSLAITGVQNAIMEGNISALTVADIKRMIQLVIRYFSMPESDLDIDNYLQVFAELWADIRDMASAENTENAVLITKLISVIDELYNYLQLMDTKGKYLQPKDRILLSKNFFKTSQLTKTLTTADAFREMNRIANLYNMGTSQPSSEDGSSASSSSSSGGTGGDFGDELDAARDLLDANSNSRFSRDVGRSMLYQPDNTLQEFRARPSVREEFGAQGQSDLRPHRAFADEREVEGVVKTEYVQQSNAAGAPAVAYETLRREMQEQLPGLKIDRSKYSALYEVMPDIDSIPFEELETYKQQLKEEREQINAEAQRSEDEEVKGKMKGVASKMMRAYLQMGKYMRAREEAEQ